MWLFVGTGKDFVAVPGGRQVERKCDKCNRSTMFYERKVTQRVSLYFIDLFAHSPQHVMACGACGAGFAVDDLSDDRFMDVQDGTALGFLGDVAGKARAAIDDGNLAQEASRLGEAVGDAASRAQRTATSWLAERLKKR